MSGACEAGEIILEEGVGPVPVEIDARRRVAISGRFRLERAPEVPDSVPSHADMAAVLSLQPGEIVDVFGAGMGVNFTFVQVADRAAVDRSAARPVRRGAGCSPTIGGRRSMCSPAT